MEQGCKEMEERLSEFLQNLFFCFFGYNIFIIQTKQGIGSTIKTLLLHKFINQDLRS